MAVADVDERGEHERMIGSERKKRRRMRA